MEFTDPITHELSPFSMRRFAPLVLTLFTVSLTVALLAIVTVPSFRRSTRISGTPQASANDRAVRFLSPLRRALTAPVSVETVEYFGTTVTNKWDLDWVREEALDPPLLDIEIGFGSEIRTDGYFDPDDVDDSLLESLYRLLSDTDDEIADCAALAISALKVHRLRSLLSSERNHPSDSLRRLITALSRDTVDRNWRLSQIVPHMRHPNRRVRQSALGAACRLSPEFERTLQTFVKMLATQRPIYVEALRRRQFTDQSALTATLSAIVNTLRDDAAVQDYVRLVESSVLSICSTNSHTEEHGDSLDSPVVRSILSGIGPEASPMLILLTRSANSSLQDFAISEIRVIESPDFPIHPSVHELLRTVSVMIELAD